MSNELRARLVIWGLAVLVLLNIGLLSVLWFDHPNQPRGPQHGERMLDPGEYIVHELGLTGVQTEKVRVLHRQRVLRADSLRTEIYRLGQDLRTHMSSLPPDTARIRLLTDTIGLRHGELEIGLYTHFHQIGALCDSLQREKLRVMVDEMMMRVQLPPAPPGSGPRDGMPPPPH